jgi:hypothetical protein
MSWFTMTGMARAAGAQTVANAQVCDGVGAGIEAFSAGTPPSSGIVHSWAGFFTRPRHAAVPSMGWSWKRRRNPARSDLTMGTLLPGTG